MEFFIIISTNTLYSHLLAENVAQIIVSYVVWKDIRLELQKPALNETHSESNQFPTSSRLHFNLSYSLFSWCFTKRFNLHLFVSIMLHVLFI